MSTYRVIDADGHVMETHPKAIGWAQNIEEPYRSQAPRHIPFRTGGGRTFLEGKIWPMPFPGADRDLEHDDFAVHVEREGMYDPHPRIKDMDIDGVDTAVLFGGVLALAVSGLDDPGLAVAVARAYNNWLAEYCQPYPDRLKGMCSMPLQDPEGAAQELRRGVTELGMVGAHFPTNVHGRDLDHASLDPVYAMAQELDVPVCVHGGYCMPGIDNMVSHRSENQFYLNLMTFPFELMTAMAKLICGGTLDRFPSLRIGIMEGNVGWLPFWVDRLDDQYAKLGRQIAAKMKPSEYVRAGRIKVTCDYEEETIPEVINAMGSENILYASDYWHADAKFPGTVAAIADRDTISDEDKAQILGKNAAGFFNIS